MTSGSAYVLCGSRACPRCRHLVLSGGTKCCHRGQARSHKSFRCLIILLLPLDYPNNGNAPGVRPSLRSGSLVPVPLRGPAATGHPLPIAALPASMPGGPLHRTSTRPPDGAGRSKAVEAADRPACLDAGLASDIFSLWEPGLPAMQTPCSIGRNKVLPSRASPLPQGIGVLWEITPIQRTTGYLATCGHWLRDIVLAFI